MDIWTIYMYQLPNGKKYIGKTKRRLSRRQGANFSGYVSCTLFYRAVQKYGAENVQQNILFHEKMTVEQASRIEQTCILLFKTNAYRFNDPEYGYNLTDGGDGQIGRKLVGKELERSMKQLQKCWEMHRGSHHPQESKRKMSLAKKGKKKGPMSEETKMKISKANSKPNPKKSQAKKKRVIVTDPMTGEVMKFESGEQTAKYFDVKPSSVTRWIDGTRKPRNGYIFQYDKSGNND